jgi:hypothetical protein
MPSKSDSFAIFVKRFSGKNSDGTAQPPSGQVAFGHGAST